MTPKLRQANTSLLDTIGQELLRADPVEPLSDHELRIAYIPAELIRPDPNQPRRVLPEAIHSAFHAQQLTPVQALREFIQLTRVIARQHGRPFAGILELSGDSLDNEDSDIEPAP